MKNSIEHEIKEYCTVLQEWSICYEEYAKSVGLSYTSLLILNMIYDYKNCTQKQICEKCFIPKQSVNTFITDLYKKNYIELKETPEDRRSKTIKFTSEGKKYADKIITKLKKSEKYAMQNLTPEERNTLIQITKSYVELCKKAMSEK